MYCCLCFSFFCNVSFLFIFYYILYDFNVMYDFLIKKKIKIVEIEFFFVSGVIFCLDIIIKKFNIDFLNLLNFYFF